LTPQTGYINLQRAVQPLSFRRTPKSAFVRLVLCIGNTFLLVTPFGMTMYLVFYHGASWNKVGWSEYGSAFAHLIIPILVNGFIDWLAGENLRTTKPN
jgi:hypothetical protein